MKIAAPAPPSPRWFVLGLLFSLVGIVIFSELSTAMAWTGAVRVIGAAVIFGTGAALAWLLDRILPRRPPASN